MREPYEVIIQPVITEKSTRQIEEGNVYTLEFGTAVPGRGSMATHSRVSATHALSGT